MYLAASDASGPPLAAMWRWPDDSTNAERRGSPTNLGYSSPTSAIVSRSTDCQKRSSSPDGRVAVSWSAGLAMYAIPGWNVSPSSGRPVASPSSIPRASSRAAFEWSTLAGISSNCHDAMSAFFILISSRTRSRKRLPSSRPHEYERLEGPASSLANAGAVPRRPPPSLCRPSQNLLGVQGKIGASSPFGTVTSGGGGLGGPLPGFLAPLVP